MLRLRSLVAAIGAGAAWAAGGGSTTPSTTTPSTTTPSTTTPSTTTPRPHHPCPNMGNGSSGPSGASYAPSGPVDL